MSSYQALLVKLPPNKAGLAVFRPAPPCSMHAPPSSCTILSCPVSPCRSRTVLPCLPAYPNSVPAPTLASGSYLHKPSVPPDLSIQLYLTLFLCDLIQPNHSSSSFSLSCPTTVRLYSPCLPCRPTHRGIQGRYGRRVTCVSGETCCSKSN